TYSRGGLFAETRMAQVITTAAYLCFLAVWILLFPARRLWLRVVIALAVWAVVALSLPVT
ncbi:MAG: hypothetical protein COZ51_04795, partial [Candidatus Aquicultor secundus]